MCLCLVIVHGYAVSRDGQTTEKEGPLLHVISIQGPFIQSDNFWKRKGHNEHKIMRDTSLKHPPFSRLLLESHFSVISSSLRQHMQIKSSQPPKTGGHMLVL